MDLGTSIRRRRQGLGAAVGVTPERVRGGMKRLGQLSLVLLAGFGVGYVVATTVLFPSPEPPPALQAVPDLRGVAIEEAQALIAEAGLLLGVVDSVRHPARDSGLVVGQSPLPGRTALNDAEVRLMVSLGPEVRPVPDVTRLRADRATIVLSASGFSVAVDTVDSRFPAGSVVQVDPAPGTELPLPGQVALRISAGPPPFRMPNVLGMDEEEARRTLSSLGLLLSEVETRLSLRNAGEVLDQAPLPDSIVELGSAVRLVVGEPLIRSRRR